MTRSRNQSQSQSRRMNQSRMMMMSLSSSFSSSSSRRFLPDDVASLVLVNEAIPGEPFHDPIFSFLLLLSSSSVSTTFSM